MILFFSLFVSSLLKTEILQALINKKSAIHKCELNLAVQCSAISTHHHGLTEYTRQAEKHVQ